LRFVANGSDLRMTPVAGARAPSRGPELGNAWHRVDTRIRSFFLEDDAATMAEYALLIALIAMVVALTLLNIGISIRTKFSSVSSCLTNHATC
jgi:Flp pilus assembly pilin Flp